MFMKAVLNRDFSPNYSLYRVSLDRDRSGLFFRIIFTGYVENSKVYQYAAAADVQCLPTLVEEAAPLVILEAMAEGLPLIVTKSGGVTEYIDDSTALMIEKEHVTENLKKAICYMKEHPEVRKQMSQKEKAESGKYNEEAYYKNFVKMIDEIVEENGRSAVGDSGK